MDNKKVDIKAIGVIPARFSSTRFPGKPLAELCGKPMIQWVYEKALQSELLTDVIIATDDKRIYQAVKEFNGKVYMTSPNHRSGMSRVTEVVKKLSVDVIVNIQGDEPLIRPKMIDQVVYEFYINTNVDIVTLKKRITNIDELDNPNVVKVVTDKYGFALYFSRAKIPYPRDTCISQWYKHIGLYGYRSKFLITIDKLPDSQLEITEGLEQLKILEYGYKIKVIETEYDTIGVDTPEDLNRVASIIQSKN
jgi:3-deoxy-manno-octulosonate cytidylyltransferase (CMP-KDO synthetase)